MRSSWRRANRRARTAARRDRGARPYPRTVAAAGGMDRSGDCRTGRTANLGVDLARNGGDPADRAVCRLGLADRRGRPSSGAPSRSEPVTKLSLSLTNYSRPEPIHSDLLLYTGVLLPDAIAQLPATPGITYRGMSGPPPEASFTVSAVLPTSADPRIATENFTADRVAAIVTVTGRYIGPLSRHPEEREVAILPATLLIPVGTVTVVGLANSVVLLAEPGDAPGLPADQEELERTVRDQIAYALTSPPVPVRSPGRFTPSSGSTAPVDNDDIWRLKVFYSTPLGDTKDGERKLFLLERTGVWYVPVFRTMDSMRASYEQMNRAAYMVLEGDVKSVMDTNRSIEPMRNVGIVIDPFGEHPVVVPPLD